MTMKTMKLALAAVAVLGVGAATAQEMGAAPVASAPVSAVPTKPVNADGSKPVSKVAEKVNSTVPADGGLNTVVEAQAEKTQAVASEAQKKEEPTARSIVQNLLAGLNEKGEPVPGKKKYKQGYDPVRRSIIQIGSALAPVANPSKSSNYIETRQMLAQEAVLNAKVAIIRELKQHISASEGINGSDSKEAEAFKKAHAELYATLASQQEKVQALVAELDSAEADRLKNRTMLDNWNNLVDAIVKKLDATVDPDEEIQKKKAERCAKLKEAVSEAKKTLKSLDDAAKEMPTWKNSSDFKTYFDMDLYGVTVLFQAESYDADGNYEVAVASVWSPKLQERAIRMLNGLKLETGKKGELSLDDWLRSKDGNLAAMIGPRQYTDDKGIAHIIGIAACEVPKNANRRQIAFEDTDLTAEQIVSFALYESTKGNKTKRDEMYKYNGEDNVSAKENVTTKSYTKTINGIIAKREVSGLSVIYRKEYAIHPISHKKLYIAVASIDGNIAEVAKDLLDEATVAKMEDIAHQKIKAAREDVRKAAVNAAENSPAAYNAGVKLGEKSLSEKINKRAGLVPSGMIVVEPARGKVEQASPKEARTGVFSGDTNANDDF